jgi:hypothetical protein
VKLSLVESQAKGNLGSKTAFLGPQRSERLQNFTSLQVLGSDLELLSVLPKTFQTWQTLLILAGTHLSR